MEHIPCNLHLDISDAGCGHVVAAVCVGGVCGEGGLEEQLGTRRGYHCMNAILDRWKLKIFAWLLALFSWLCKNFAKWISHTFGIRGPSIMAWTT